MENAGEALKMAAAMLIFVGALSIAILVLSRARQTSAAIMDRKEAAKSFYSVGNIQSEKEVGVDTVIANLYNYYQSQSTILFFTGDRDADGNISNIKPMTLYYSEANDEVNESKGYNVSILDKSTLKVENSDKHDPDTPPNKRAIYGVDTHDELVRQEPWSRNEETAKQFIDALVNRKETPGYDISLYKNYKSTDYAINDGRNSNNKFKPMGSHIDNTSQQLIYDYQLFYNFVYQFYGNKSLAEMSDSSDNKFIERVGIYNYEAIYDKTLDPNETVTDMTYSNVEKDRSRIYFDDIDDSIENKDGQKKTVIEYIYIKN